MEEERADDDHHATYRALMRILRPLGAGLSKEILRRVAGEMAATGPNDSDHQSGAGGRMPAGTNREGCPEPQGAGTLALARPLGPLDRYFRPAARARSPAKRRAGTEDADRSRSSRERDRKSRCTSRGGETAHAQETDGEGWQVQRRTRIRGKSRDLGLAGGRGRGPAPTTGLP